jgi:hypothetical protein
MKVEVTRQLRPAQLAQTSYIATVDLTEPEHRYPELIDLLTGAQALAEKAPPTAQVTLAGSYLSAYWHEP